VPNDPVLLSLLRAEVQPTSGPQHCDRVMVQYASTGRGGELVSVFAVENKHKAQKEWELVIFELLNLINSNRSIKHIRIVVVTVPDSMTYKLIVVRSKANSHNSCRRCRLGTAVEQILKLCQISGRCLHTDTTGSQ